jgi:hypothetical protein
VTTAIVLALTLGGPRRTRMIKLTQTIEE